MSRETGRSTREGPGGRQRALLAVAAAAVSFAAADTYVVVLALPEMMSGVGLATDELQRGAPIVSGFLLGYVAMLPLVGRIADLRGRVPVLVGSLLLFVLGSLVTAAAYDLPSLTAGRFVQGVGGGGLVPATLALVADLYPAGRRGPALGVVGAVQELGSVLGPLFGGAVLAVAGWREIFWVNLGVGLVLAAALLHAARGWGRGVRARWARVDWPGAVLAAVAVVVLALVLLQPRALTRDVTLGAPFVPLAGQSRWLSPLGVVLLAAVIALLLRCATAAAPLLDVRRWAGLLRAADLVGAVLMALMLGGVILAFATADPQVQVLSPAGPWLLLGALVAAGLLGWRLREARHPLVPPATFAPVPAWGSLLVSLLVGAALIAALVDVPLLARVTVYPDSQLLAALVLVRLLVAVPVGALLGGALVPRLPAGVITAVGMGLCVLGFAWMATWGLTSLEHPVATAPLVLAGLGFGLALAPVNAALLAATGAAVHGVASAMLVVARMVGMLVGISALTTLGLRRYYAVSGDIPAPTEVCEGASRCAAYTTMLKEAALAQLHTVFLGGAVCAVLAGLVALATFRTAPTRGVAAASALRLPG